MKDISTNENFTCPRCNSKKSNTLISATNFKYYYCGECNFNFNECVKQKEFDILLKKIVEYFKDDIDNDCIKIELIKNDNYFDLIINNNIILKQNLTYQLSNTDIYFLENTIFELIEDIDENSKLKSNIIVCA